MKRASDVLKTLMPTMMLGDSEEKLNIFSSWANILGDELEEIAAHSEPVDIKNGALILYVDHPGWVQRIDFKKTEILSRLQKVYSPIENLFIQRVNNERFIERREERFLGRNSKS